MNVIIKKRLSSKISQAKRRIRCLDIELARENITASDHKLFKDPLEDYILILTWQQTRILVDDDLTKLVNCRSKTFTTNHHDSLVDKLDSIDHKIANLQNSFNKKIVVTQATYPKYRVS